MSQMDLRKLIVLFAIQRIFKLQVALVSIRIITNWLRRDTINKKQWSDFMPDKKLLKSEKIRIKNDKLRAQGKDPLKGSKQLVNNGITSSAMAGSPGVNPTNLEIKASNVLEK